MDEQKVAKRVAKRRLLILASTYPRWKGDHEPGFVHELASRLTDRFEVVAVVPHASGAAREEILDGVRVVRYGYAPSIFETLVNNGGISANLSRNPWKWLLVPSFVAMQWIAARRELTENTSVHAHWIIPQGLVGVALRKPLLITCHGADIFTLRGRLALILKRFVIKGANRIAIVSHAMMPPALAISGAKPISVLPMGVDLRNRFTPDKKLARCKFNLLFVGRLVEKKGVDILLHAMPAVLSKFPDATLTIVGHGPLAPDLRNLANLLKLDHAVQFVGPMNQEELPSIYRRAAVFIAPFREAASGDQEGLGLVLVEALGCGCPVVASDIPATRDVLSKAQGVIVVAPSDHDALARAVLHVLDDSDRYSKLVVADRERLMSQFDWDSVAENYGKTLDQMV